MKGWIRARRWRGCGVACLFAGLLASGCDNEGGPCDRPGEEWCEGNQIVACLASGSDPLVRGDPVSAQGIDCGDYGGSCVEWNDNLGVRVAGCAAPSGGCASEGESACDPEWGIWRCEPPLEFVMYGCAGEYCTVDAYDRAHCTYYPGLCTTGDTLCDPDDPGSYFRCVDGVWLDEESCDVGLTCVQISATEASCS